MDPAGASIEFLLNGRPVSIASAHPQTTLLDALRSHGLTSVKEGCAEGECGTCMVALVVNGPHGAEYRPVNSCLMFLPMAAGQEIYTAEGLLDEGAAGRVSAVQEAIAEAGGSQCGYCTPGFAVSLFAEFYRPDRAGACDPLALAGNLCRCTGYRPIADAGRSLGQAPDDRFRQRLASAAPAIVPARTPAFSRPGSVDECIALLAAEPSARLVAGATDLGVEANLKQQRWGHMVSLDAIDELRAFVETDASIRIGAALPLTDIGCRWPDAPPAVGEWLELFASPPIRHRATLGGNLVTASPIGDAAPLLLAMDASVQIAGPSGRRRVPLAEFFTGYRKTVLAPGELLTMVEIPKPLPTDLRFYKISKRRLDDISTVSAAFALHEDGTRVRQARVAFGGVGATPLRVKDAEREIESRPFSEDAATRARAIVGRLLTPMSDHRGSREYRLAVAQALVEKFWWETRA
jgi:xanthine dehydrogenase small subunit